VNQRLTKHFEEHCLFGHFAVHGFIKSMVSSMLACVNGVVQP
jgi:hypothetical protein